jgi:putative membrane protein
MMNGFGQMMNGFGQMFGFGGAGMIVGVIFWAAILALLVWGVFALALSTRNQRREAPLAVLERRYARGEITFAELEQARRALE